MVTTIDPVVYGGRNRSYLVAVALHVLGAGAAAAAVGAVLGGLGALLGAPWGRSGLVIVALVALLYAAREGAQLPVPLPDRRRQVPEWWRTFFPRPVAALLYGVGLGTAFLTFLTFGTFVAVAVAALASGSPLVGAAVCAPFGVARGLSILVGARRGGGAALDRLEDLGATAIPRRVNAVALAAVAIVALAGLL